MYIVIWEEGEGMEIIDIEFVFFVSIYIQFLEQLFNFFEIKFEFLLWYVEFIKEELVQKFSFIIKSVDYLNGLFWEIEVINVIFME